jgi:hypothetical protein
MSTRDLGVANDSSRYLCDANKYDLLFKRNMCSIFTAFFAMLPRHVCSLVSLNHQLGFCGGQRRSRPRHCHWQTTLRASHCEVLKMHRRSEMNCFIRTRLDAHSGVTSQQ